MDRVSALLDEVNRALAPWAELIGDIQNAPVWVIGARAELVETTLNSDALQGN